MNILITGHRGMIGSRLYEYLKKEDRYSVDGIDIVDGSGDILTFQFNKIYNIVIHCAALTSVVDSIKYPDKYYKTNVLGSNNIIKQCTNSKLIFFSTSAVYGEGLNHSEISPYKPPCPYAKNKVAVEAIIKNTLKNWLILRLSNIFGGIKGERNVYQVFEEEDILPIYGNGNSIRDYLHVDTLVKIVCKNLEKCGTYNIGSGQLKTVLDIAKEFNKPIKYFPKRFGEIEAISLDLTKAKKDKLL